MLPVHWFSADSELTCFLAYIKMHRLNESSEKVAVFSIFVDTQDNLWNTVSRVGVIFKFTRPHNLKHVFLYCNAYLWHKKKN